MSLTFLGERILENPEFVKVSELVLNGGDVVPVTSTSCPKY
jgi:hypothetical protein